MRNSVNSHWYETGVRLFKEGAEDYSVWSSLMLRVCGLDAEPHLEDIWGEIAAPTHTSTNGPKFAYKLLATLLVVGVCGWLWHPLGAASAILFAGSFRQPIVRKAAFWDTKTILGVGIVWGVSMAIAVRTVSSLATTSHFGLVALYLEGLVAVNYVGYRPEAVDLFMYNKARQTAVVGTVCYLATMICLLVFRGWAG